MSFQNDSPHSTTDARLGRVKIGAAYVQTLHALGAGASLPDDAPRATSSGAEISVYEREAALWQSSTRLRRAIARTGPSESW